MRQGAVDKAKADDQRHAGERQHHHLKVRKAVGGKQRKIVQEMLPPKVSPSLVGASRRKVHGGGSLALRSPAPSPAFAPGGTTVDLVEVGAASLREPALANLARLAAQILALGSSSRSKA
jgi:hypothetical protein